MIQILLQHNENFTTAEMAQMAIECGYKWLILPDNSLETLREEAGDIVAMCREAGTILTIVDNADAARELGLHGVLLTKGHNPTAVREELGPEAIVGTEISSIASVTALINADIDYFVIKPDEQALLIEARTANIVANFVADLSSADIDIESMRQMKNEGAAGFMIGTQSFNHIEPEAALKSLLESFA